MAVALATPLVASDARNLAFGSSPPLTQAGLKDPESSTTSQGLSSGATLSTTAGCRQDGRLLGRAVCHRRGVRRVGNSGCAAASYVVAGVMSEPEIHDGRWRPRRDAGRKNDVSEELYVTGEDFENREFRDAAISDFVAGGCLGLRSTMADGVRGVRRCRNQHPICAPLSGVVRTGAISPFRGGQRVWRPRYVDGARE